MSDQHGQTSDSTPIDIDVANEFRIMDGAVEAYREILNGYASRKDELREAFTAHMVAERLEYGQHRMLCNTLRPHFLTRRIEAYVHHVTTTLTRAMHRLARQAIEDEDMQKALRITEAERLLLRVHPGNNDLSALSRLDTFLSADGLHLVEYNAECPTGAGYNQRLFRVFDNLAPLRDFTVNHVLEKADGTTLLLRTLLDAWREWGGQGTPCIGIVDWDDVVTRGEFEILGESFRAQDVPTVIVDPRELELRDGRLYGGGMRIDLVYRRLLTAEFLAARPSCSAFDEAYHRQAACFVNNFRTKLLHKKLIFGLLRDDRWQHLLGEEERELVRVHVPWTIALQPGKVIVEGERVELLAYAYAHQADLVLKPNDDYGGKGLLLGSESTPDEWKSGLAYALASGHDHVLQQRIPLHQASFPDLEGTWRDYYVDLDPFFYRDRTFGHMCRMSTNRVSNVTTGGGQIPAYMLH